MIVAAWLHSPNWSAAEWASVLSTVFGAAAAVAAWRAVAISAALQRAARVPQVSGGVHHQMRTGQVTLGFANAGPVLAVQVVYFMVAQGAKAGGLVGDGHLAVGEKITVDPRLPPGGSYKDPAHLVWSWRDLDDNVFFRSSDWKQKRFSRRAYVRRKDTTLGGMFREMFPDVAIP